MNSNLSVILISSTGLFFDIIGFYILYIYVEARLRHPDDKLFWGERPTRKVIISGSFICFGFILQIISNFIAYDRILAAVVAVLFGIVTSSFGIILVLYNKHKITKTYDIDDIEALSGDKLYFMRLWIFSGILFSILGFLLLLLANSLIYFKI